jgi:hypothetical protein
MDCDNCIKENNNEQLIEPNNVAAPPQPRMQVEVQLSKPKRGKGRPKKYDVPAKQKFNEMKYFTDYYRSHKDIKVECPVCKEMVMKYTIQRHKRTQKCLSHIRP